MPDHTTFIHLSDTHIAPKGELVHDIDTAQHLRDVLARVREMDVSPACFILSGDLSNHGDIESYIHLRELVEEIDAFDVPILLGLGNHDNRVNFRRIMLGEADADDESEPCFYSHTIGDLRVLMLDSKVPDRVDGLLGERQLAWLDQQLQDPAPGGDIVVLHHPCLPRGVPRPNDFLLQDAPALATVLERHEVLAILAGHSHVSSISTYGGTLHATTPATAFLLDPSIRDGGRGLDGAGFNLCVVRDDRLIVNPIILPGTQAEVYRYSQSAVAAMNEPVTAAS